MYQIGMPVRSKIKFAFTTLLLCHLVVSFTLQGSCQSTERDSALVYASAKYNNPGFLVQFMLGRNYRRDWEQPVKMEVIKLSSVQGGLKIVALGGGHQTQSLRLVTKKGEELVLRSVDKTVAKVLPSYLRATMAEQVAQDMVSAAEPYGPLVVAPLADAIHIIAAHPKLYYVSNDPEFGKYRTEFAHKVCFLEERYPLKPSSKYVSMKEVLEDQQNASRYIVDQKQVLRARLLDMLIADWDRHQGQWRWGLYDSAGRKYLYAVPVDHDQAFFHSDGFVPWVAAKTVAHFLTGFNKKMGDLSKLNEVAKNFDRLFLNNLSEAEWVETITDVQHSLPDSILEYAVKQLPVGIYERTGPNMIGVLKSRRDGLLAAGMGYYRKLAKSVYIIGIDSRERFEFTSINDSLSVRVYSATDNRILYQRSFNALHTKNIYLVGVEENDIVKKDPAFEGQIKIEVIKPKDRKDFDIRQRVLKRLKDKQGGR